MEKWGLWGLKRPKNMVLIGNKDMGGGALAKAPKEKWGKMGENAENCGKFWMLDGKMGNLGAEKVKKHGFDSQQGYGGGALAKAPKEKWGKMGENGGKCRKLWEILDARWKNGEFGGRKGQKTWF